MTDGNIYPSAKLHAVRMPSTLGDTTYFLLLLVPNQGGNETDPWAVVCWMYYTKGIFNILAQLWEIDVKTAPVNRSLPSPGTMITSLTKYQPHWFSLRFSSIKLTSDQKALHLLSLIQILSPKSSPNGFFLTIQVLASSERPSLTDQLKVVSLYPINLLLHYSFFSS